MDYSKELEQSITYLRSADALKSLQADAYWPKWNSTWWHMLLLFEMGMVSLIPENVISAYIDAINKVPVKIFPIHPGELPEGVDPFRGSPCHCQLGNVYQTLASRGVDVDQEVPWIRPWFLKYQMSDGGLNCDNDAYLVKNETPSSMVGTIAVFESILLHTNRAWTPEEETFLKKSAHFLIQRELRKGSHTEYNKAERKSAQDWTKLCFPRFYLYDVLRGLNAILLWVERTNSFLPAEAVAVVVQTIKSEFPDGKIKIGRHSYANTGTLMQMEDNSWKRQPATFFPLLDKVSRIGEVSPFLSSQWSQCIERLRRHNHLSGLV